MEIIEITAPILSTDDCKKQLNTHLGVKKWKRLYKFGTLRCFINEDKKAVTIAENEEGEFCLFVDVNIESELRAIKEIAKMYYTVDYGDMYYNPETSTLFIVGGDGGYAYSVSTPKKDKYGEIDWDNMDEFVEFNTHPTTTFIKNVIWEAESRPDEPGYMLIGKIKLADE